MSRLFPLVFSVLLGLAPAVAKDGPADVIRKVYEAYAASSANPDAKVPDQYDKRRYSRRVDKLIDRLEKACKDVDIGCYPDFDFLVDGQDFQISKLEVREVSRDKGRAIVNATFLNFDQKRDFTFYLVQEKGVWLIDGLNVPEGGGSFAYTLDDILEPQKG
jgi:hypothetical protein